MNFLTIVSFDLVRFLTKPNDERLRLTVLQRLKLLLFLLGIAIFGTVVLTFPIDELLSSHFEIYKSPATTLKSYSIRAIVFAPLIEDTIFRLALRRNFLFAKFIPLQIWYRLFPILVYGSSIIFGLIHLNNFYFVESIIWVLSPLLILNQLFGSFLLAYIRIRLNFWWGCLFHGLFNASTIVLLLIVCFAKKPIDVQAPNYTLHAKHYAFRPTEAKEFVDVDKKGGKIFRIYAHGNTVGDVIGAITSDSYYIQDNEFVDLEFSSPGGLPADSVLHILSKEYRFRRSVK